MKSRYGSEYDDVLRNLNNPTWTSDVMAVALADKKRRREAKGKKFTCFVLERNIDTEKDELFTFFKLLKESIKQNIVKEGTRFQLAIKHGEHWTPFDCQIRDGKLNFFCIDAVMNEGFADHIRDIKSIFPDAIAYYYKADITHIDFSEKIINMIREEYTKKGVLITKETKEEISKKADEVIERGQRIQFDGISCSRFTLQHIFIMSNLDIFSELEKNKVLHKQPKMYVNNLAMEYKVWSGSMTGPMAKLFTYTQSWKILNSLPNNLKEWVVNKKGQTLIEAAESESTERINEGLTRKTNKGIENFKDKIISSEREFMRVDELRDVETALADRQGYKFLRGEKSPVRFDAVTWFDLPNAVRSVLSKCVQEYSNELKSTKSKIRSSDIKAALKDMQEFLNYLTHVRDAIDRCSKSVLESDEGLDQKTILGNINKFMSTLPRDVAQRIYNLNDTQRSFVLEAAERKGWYTEDYLNREEISKPASLYPSPLYDYKTYRLNALKNQTSQFSKEEIEEIEFIPVIGKEINIKTLLDDLHQQFSNHPQIEIIEKVILTQLKAYLTDINDSNIVIQTLNEAYKHPIFSHKNTLSIFANKFFKSHISSSQRELAQMIDDYESHSRSSPTKRM